MIGFFEITLLLSAPLLLAALGELVLEKSGSIQIGTEGTMLIGAFTTFAASRKGASPTAALALGLAVGALFGLLFAAIAVARRADPILTGTAWNILALGLTAYGYRLLAGETGAVLEIAALRHGVLGLPALVVASFALPPLAHVFLTFTRPGLALSAAGENPEAVLAVGRSVVAIRGAASTFAGAMSGLAGGLLIVTVSPTFVEGVTAGRGFLALALVVFARWRPLRLIPGALLLGGAAALQYRLQASGASNVPYAFLLALPGILALAALGFSSSRATAPKALGAPAP